MLLVHGGPWVRGRAWEWRSDAQFLASRGHVVIEPEFRGSEGDGQTLHRAGWRQWGRAMQDDLIDALDWAVARDGARLRCGVAWVGVSDPRLMFEWTSATDISTDSRAYDSPALIGDPQADAAMLDSVTPVLLADRITAPLLLAYGGRDRRVPLVQGERMRQPLVDAGRPPEWVLYPDEGHGLAKIETQLDFARRLEAFLAQHLR